VPVRLATDADVELLATLRRTWVEEDGPVDEPLFEQEFADWYAAEAHQRTTWIGFADTVPVGMLNLLEFRRMPRPGRLRSGWGYISNVFVLAEHRNRGLGKDLLDAAIATAKERGYARLVLSPTERARPFYGRAGFAVADELVLLSLG